MSGIHHFDNVPSRLERTVDGDPTVPWSPFTDWVADPYGGRQRREPVHRTVRMVARREPANQEPFDVMAYLDMLPVTPWISRELDLRPRRERRVWRRVLAALTRRPR